MVAALAFYFYNSQKVPVTGRRRFNFLSDAWVEASHKRDAEMVIEEVVKEGGKFLSEWDPRTIAVKTVMQRLIPLSGLEHLEWEIHVIDDSSRSSFSLTLLLAFFFFHTLRSTLYSTLCFFTHAFYLCLLSFLSLLDWLNLLASRFHFLNSVRLIGFSFLYSLL